MHPSAAPSAVTIPVATPLRRLALLIVTTGLLLAACSGGSAPVATAGAAYVAPTAAPVSTANAVNPTPAPPASVSGQTDPACALVTADDVAKAAGFAIATTLGAGGTCIFQNTDPSKVLAVQLFTNQSSMAALLGMESSGEHIAGLGDDAFWVSTAGLFFVRKGDRGAEFTSPNFSFTDPTNTGVRDAFVTLARTALPNL